MKLIIVNGPCGVGKSTLSKKLQEQISLSVFISVDEIRRFISDYKKYRKESGILAFELSLGMISQALENGNDVIIDKLMFDYPEAPKNYLLEFEKLANKYKANVFEFILTANTDVIINRVKKRGLSDESLLTMENVVRFCDEIEKFISQRKNAHIVDTTNLDKGEVFEIAWNVLNKN